MKRKIISAICLLVLMIMPIFLQACEGTTTRFEVVSLDIVPPTVISSEKAIVRAEIKNSGTSLKTYTMPLMVNGIADNRKSISLAPGAKETIEFALVRSKPGTYKIAIGERSSTLEVRKAIPADFKISNLEISPAAADVGEKIVITAKIANTGGSQGSYVADLKIDGVVSQTEKLTIPAGTDYTQIFGLCADFPGTYQVNLGGLTGEFVVKSPVVVIPVPGRNSTFPTPTPTSKPSNRPCRT